MKTPLAWEYDLGELHRLRDVLKSFVPNPPYKLYNTRLVTKARDDLGRFVDDMAQAGMDAVHEEAYLHLFDALSFLTEALRTPQVHMPYYHQSLSHLECVVENTITY